jgi:tetratricopeptide (TPR) repeat protein
VRAQLSDASGFTVVPYSYEGALENVFSMQDEIVGAIAAAVRAPLGLENAVGHAGTESLEAYELYVAARRECAEGHKTPEGFERALSRIERAVAIDPKFARAWMFKSQVHSMRAAFIADGAAELVAAEEAAVRAIALAPENGEGYNARALILGTKGDWRGAVRDYQRAHALGFMESPDVPVLLASGRIQEVRTRIGQLLEIDQLNEDLLAFLTVAHEILADTGGADEIFRRGTRLYDPWEFGDLVGMWIRLGRERIEQPYAGIALAQPFAAFAAQAGQPDRALALIKRAASDPANQAATVLASLSAWAAHFGDDKLALELLSRSLHGSALNTYLAWLPVFHNVRALPEFRQLLRDLGLVDYWRTTGWPDVCRPVGADDFTCA